MLITQLKDQETIVSLTDGKKFLSSTARDARKFISRKKKPKSFRQNYLLPAM
jgi:hypothetical protein